MVYEGVCNDFVAARFSNNQSQTSKVDLKEWESQISAVRLLPNLNLRGGVSRLGDGWFGF